MAVESKQTKFRSMGGAGRKRNYGVMALLCLPFLIALYVIFKPGSSEAQRRAGGILLTVPDGREQQIEGDKRKAMEQQRQQEQQSERVRTLADGDFSLTGDTMRREGVATPRNDIVEAQTSYRELTREANTFYAPAPPRVSSEVAALQEQVAALRAELEARQPKSDPMEYMERSYALASKYLGGHTSGAPAAVPAERKEVLAHRTPDHTVSTLAQPLEDSVFMTEYGQARNYGFNTAVGEGVADNRNAIRACIDCDQVVRSGETVRLRLLEAMQVDRYVLPANAVLWGVAGIDGQRLSILVSSIESGGNIIPVRLTAHDLDGQAGLNIPGSMTRDALKDAAASIGSSLGQSVTFARDAGQQVAMDVTRGVMTGGTQYLSNRLREVKITLKAGYKLLLISQE